MSRNTGIFSSLFAALLALGGCSSQPPAGETKKAAVPLEKIQGRVEVEIGSDFALENFGRIFESRFAKSNDTCSQFG